MARPFEDHALRNARLCNVFKPDDPASMQILSGWPNRNGRSYDFACGSNIGAFGSCKFITHLAWDKTLVTHTVFGSRWCLPQRRPPELR